LSLSLPIPSLAVRVATLAFVAFVAGCSTPAKWNTPGKKQSSASSIFGGFSKKGGGYYLDDGPGDDPPPDLHAIPDAVPRHEPLRPANMRPYAALGKWYTPKTGHESYRERGVASWYGRRYHGQRTATGEVYDMYGMTAAHPTLPLPSYVRVTNISNGKSVVLRVNDRGPFLSDRLIDLSYTAAYKLDVLDSGSTFVEVESILPGTFPDTQVAVASVPDPMQFPVREKANPRPLADVERRLERPFERPLQTARPDLFEVLDAPKESVSVKDNSVKDNSARVIAASEAGAAAGGIYLQLGAFSAYDNADSFLARMRAELPSLLGNLGIVAVNGLFKVHAGPYPDHTMARQAADKIAQSLSIKPMLLKR
jgi:rare lipoprotein A